MIQYEKVSDIRGGEFEKMIKNNTCTLDDIVLLRAQSIVPKLFYIPFLTVRKCYLLYAFISVSSAHIMDMVAYEYLDVYKQRMSEKVGKRR